MPAELVTTLAATEEQRLMQAEAMVRAYCGWHVAPVRRETWIIDHTDARVLTLPTLRLKDVISVTDRRGWDGVTELVPALPSAYEWSEAGMLTLHTCADWDWDVTRYSFTREPYGWRRGGFRALVVDVEHGFDAAPFDLAGIVQAMATRAVANPSGVTREQVGPFAYTYSGSSSTESLALAILPSERSVLDHYKLPPRP